MNDPATECDLRPAIGSAESTRAALPRPRVPGSRVFSHVARVAVRSLYRELALYPKPGLVSLVDSGSHADMTAATLFRSLVALRHYFARIARAGWEGLAFDDLKRLGIEAEQRMLRATHGVNTHRGAIFCLGLLCAAAGACFGSGRPLKAPSMRAALLRRWRADLRAHALLQAGASAEASHGQQAARRYAVAGARAQAALGFPAVFDIGEPALRRALAAGRSADEAMLESLFLLMARIADTNLYHRGGAQGAAFVRSAASAFIERGATAHRHWREFALDLHHRCIALRLSPGGAADLLAASWFVHELTTGPSARPIA